MSGVQGDEVTDEASSRPGDMLHGWQRAAVEAWLKGDEQGPHRGTLEVFTGGGKTLIGLAAYDHVRASDPSVRLVVVVPSVALVAQWRKRAIAHLGLVREQVGQLGGGQTDALSDHQVLIAVINTAADALPEHGLPSTSVMLLVDECHRAGAPEHRKVLATPSAYRLGLSATPQRDDTDEDGQIEPYDVSVLGRQLGHIVYRFDLAAARAIGWLPDYTLNHHGVGLSDDERSEYERLSRRVDDAADRLRESGRSTAAARTLAAGSGPLAEAARDYVSATSGRKDLLYRATQRTRVAALLARAELTRRPATRMILFHERVDQAVELWTAIKATVPEPERVVLEHSRLGARERRAALERFASGDANVLVSVRSLIEGIDVPEADVGISVAASSSVRQRVQSLGRVLRRTFDGSTKQASMHLLYVTETVDEYIYAREDWGDLTGPDANKYWLWTEEGPPEEAATPPATPKPTEEQVWTSLGEQVPGELVPWSGVLPELDYSVDTRGNVRTPNGATVHNGQVVVGMVVRVRGRPGGRFRITPHRQLVLVQGAGGSRQWMIAGQLAEPLTVRAPNDEPETVPDVTTLRPGEALGRKPDADWGSFHLRQKSGGLIERRRGRDREFALTTPLGAPSTETAIAILGAWRELRLPGLPISIASDGTVWFEADGEARLLVRVEAPLAFTSDDRGSQDG